ncbi:MAG TPA: squalene/phytoene synthase family protein, partial [Kiloniellales bacterium]
MSYCAALIRQHDHDRYLTALLAPRDRRESLFALYAFNLEVARIAEVAREAPLGEIRLQWWRDALGTGDVAAAAQHPVAAPLRGAIARHQLDRGCIDRLLDGRRRDLDATPPADVAALEAYVEATS